MMSRFIQINMWYENLLHTDRSLRFIIFLSIMVVVFALPQPFQILALLAVLILRLIAGYAQNYVQTEERIKEKLQAEITARSKLPIAGRGKDHAM